MTEPSTPRFTIERKLPPLLLILLSLAAMGRIVFNDFSGWDDPENFTSNARLSPPTVESTLSYWKRPTAGLYAPLTYNVWCALARLSYAISGAIKPWLFHLASLIVHIVSSLFVYSLLLRLLPAD